MRAAAHSQCACRDVGAHAEPLRSAEGHGNGRAAGAMAAAAAIHEANPRPRAPAGGPYRGGG